MGEKTTIEQLCALCGPINTETHFTKLYAKRGAALYQSLFLNKRLSNPIDTDYEIDSATNDTKPIINPITGLPIIDPLTGAPFRRKLSDHLPAMLGALRNSEADLAADGASIGQ